MKRRSFLKAAPAALAPGATLAAFMAGARSVEAKGETPIMRLFRKQRALTEAAKAHVSIATGKGEDDELYRLYYHQINKIEAEMMALPCTCAADFAAKTIVDTVSGSLFSDWETSKFWQEARALVGGMV